MIKLGIDQIDAYMHLFEGKRVGLMTNPTGMNQNLISTIDILYEKTNLVSLFAPEHGIRGELQAGVHFDDYLDEETHCKVYSVYGKLKAPTDDMLKVIDVMCFDIQDVGARFYTFIYSMAYAMMACAKNNVSFVVFDRPNPVGGIKVEGNILDLEYRSFVGYYPITQRYGLTIGELALYFNDAYEIGCDLKVIPLKGWKRSMHYQDLDIPWIMPSPNIPTPLTTFAYLATCYFEGTNVSEGRGTTRPFEMIGAPWLNASLIIKYLNEQSFQGVQFRKVYFTPSFSKHKDTLCEGIDILITDTHLFEPVKVGMHLLYFIKKHHPEFEIRAPFKKGKHSMIEYLLGQGYLTDDKKTLDQVLLQMENDQDLFRKMKGKYHLYDE